MMIAKMIMSICLILCLHFVQYSICHKAQGQCGRWHYGSCEKMTRNGGTCGRGTKKATRVGNSTSCHPSERVVTCTVPCPGDKKVCKYRRGQWSECDPVTLKRVRTDTLMIELSDPSCAHLRPFEKHCKKKLCYYGKWTDYGPCQNGYQTRTRPILSGTQEQCNERTKKTRRCQSNG